MRKTTHKILNRYLPLTISVVLVVIAGATYLISSKSTKPAEAAWYSSSWTSRKVMTIDHTKVSTASSTTLTNFPVLFSRTDTDLKTVANGGSVGKSDGSDILFTLGDGVTKLNHELESYSSTTGTTIAWVQVPTLSPTVDTTLYIYYGNSGATNQQNAAAVWDSNYKGVWHLSNGSANDSTSNANNGTLINSPTAGTGQIGGGFNFVSASSNYIQTPSISSLGGASKAVMSAWIKRTASGNNAIILTNDGSNLYLFGIAEGGFWGAGNVAFIAGNNNISWGTIALNDSSWHFFEMVYDGTQSTDATRLLGYVDGVKQTLNFSQPGIPATILGVNNAINLGYAAGTGNLSDASMDEFRITTAATRSADWIVTEYNNQNSPATFFKTYGSQQVYTSQNVLWYNSSWSYRKPITIDHNKVSGVASSTLNSFPVLINVTDSDLKFTGSGGKVASSTGADILFTDSSGTSLLNYEIESYASTTGALVAWVRIPVLSAVTDTTIYEYFGNASAPAEVGANITGTWNTNYKAVWHLNNSVGANSVLDSTTNGANSGPYSSAGATSGKIGNGVQLGDISTYGAAFYNIGNPDVTISCWFKSGGSVGSSGYYAPCGFTWSGNSFGFKLIPGSNLIALGTVWTTSATGQCSFSYTPDSTWHYLTATLASGQNLNSANVYMDGVSQSLTCSPAIAVSINASLDIGQWDGDGNAAPGANTYADEFRWSNVVRSTDWIKTEYNNQNSPSAFYAYGAIQSQSVTGSGDSFKSRGTSSLGWYNSSWSYRKPITIDHNKVGVGTTTPLSNFPMLFTVTDSDLKYTGFGGKVASSTGADIIFTDSNGTSLLNYEVESYSPTTGNIIAWVKVPSVLPSSDTTIYVYFGNSSAAANSTINKQGTWDSNYIGVYHMPNGSTLSGTDSTSYGHNATVSGTSPTATTGKIDGGMLTNTASHTSNSTTYLQTGTQLDASTTNLSTVSVWEKGSSSAQGYGYLFFNGTACSTGDYSVSINSPSLGYSTFNLQKCQGGGANSIVNIGSLAIDTNWHYVSVVFKAGTVNLYIDGSFNASTSVVSGTFYPMSDSAISLSNSSGFDGVLDEARVSTGAARTADWIATEYKNQNSPTTFYTYGSLQAQSRVTVPSAIISTVAYDSHAEGSSFSPVTDWTFNITVGSSSNRVLLCGVHSNGGSDITGVLDAGVSMTLLSSIDAGSFRPSYLYWIANPPTGSNTITIQNTHSGAFVNFASCISYSGVSQLQPTNLTSAHGDGTSHQITTTLTTAVNNAWISAYEYNDTGDALTAGSNTTLEGANNNGTQFADSNGPKNPIGSYSLAVNLDGSYTNAKGLMVELDPASLQPSNIAVPAVKVRGGVRFR